MSFEKLKKDLAAILDVVTDTLNERVRDKNLSTNFSKILSVGKSDLQNCRTISEVTYTLNTFFKVMALHWSDMWREIAIVRQNTKDALEEFKNCVVVDFENFKPIQGSVAEGYYPITVCQMILFNNFNSLYADTRVNRFLSDLQFSQLGNSLWKPFQKVNSLNEEDIYRIIEMFQKKIKSIIFRETHRLEGMIKSIFIDCMQELLSRSFNDPLLDYGDSFNMLVEALRIPYLLYHSKTQLYFSETASSSTLEDWKEDWNEFFEDIKCQIELLILENVEEDSLITQRVKMTQMLRFLHELNVRYYAYDVRSSEDEGENDCTHTINKIKVGPFFEMIYGRAEELWMKKNKATAQDALSMPLLVLLNQSIEACANWAFDEEKENIPFQVEALYYSNDEIVSQRRVDYKLENLIMLHKLLSFSPIETFDNFAALLKLIGEFKSQDKKAASYLQQLQAYLIFVTIVPTAAKITEFFKSPELKKFGLGNLQNDRLAIGVYLDKLECAKATYRVRPEDVHENFRNPARCIFIINGALSNLYKYYKFLRGCQKNNMSATAENPLMLHLDYIQQEQKYFTEFSAQYSRAVTDYLSQIIRVLPERMGMSLRIEDSLNAEKVSIAIEQRKKELGPKSEEITKNKEMQATVKLLCDWRSQVEAFFQYGESTFFSLIIAIFKECEGTEDAILRELQKQIVEISKQHKDVFTELEIVKLRLQIPTVAAAIFPVQEKKLFRSLSGEGRSHSTGDLTFFERMKTSTGSSCTSSSITSLSRSSGVLESRSKSRCNEEAEQENAWAPTRPASTGSAY